MLVYLGICAVLAFLAALTALFFAVLPAPTFHIFFAAGAMPLIFGAIIHFVPVLTRSSSPPRAIHYLPLPVQLVGILAPLGLAGVLPGWSLHAAASVVSLAALVLASWTTRRLRGTLGAPHPGARWYGAALLCLFFAVSLVPVWLSLPELRPALRLFHLHLNTLGFIGLAALGTLPVLLPTALGLAEPAAAQRLRKHLLPAAGGALLVAAGAAAGAWLALPGALLLLWVIGANVHAAGTLAPLMMKHGKNGKWARPSQPPLTGRLPICSLRSILQVSPNGVFHVNLAAWWRAYGAKVGAGGTAPLVAATFGLALLLLAGIAHALGGLPARPAIGGFIAMFLLPLVTGALAQLLPVWRHPGSDSPRRRRMRERLARNGALRAALFLAGGGLLSFDLGGGLALAAAGVLLFASALFGAFWLDSPEASDDNPRPD